MGEVVGGGGLVGGVGSAGVADPDGALLDAVVAIRGAAVDGVLVVEAAAGGVQLNDLVAHDGELRSELT